VGDEIGRLGATLAAMLDRLRVSQLAQRDLLERQRRFLADASHQLRTPLARTITVRAEPSLILADPQRLEHALGNLVDNALVHGAGEIELASWRTGDVVRVQVRDHGNGFAADYLANPFQRFASSNGAGRENGLGLAIVQAIAEAHGGTAQLGNDGGGSVIMELPVHRL
jgi:signal transduction histidine kinase